MDLSCACGKTSIPPPFSCGTPTPSCTHQCLIPQPCSHAASHTCHFGDCPPCSVPIAKECIGRHVLLRNIPCGSKDIRCNQLCVKTQQCGMHACTRVCHPPPRDSPPACGSVSGGRSSCGQICGTPRRRKHGRIQFRGRSIYNSESTYSTSAGGSTWEEDTSRTEEVELRREKLGRKKQLADAFDIDPPNLDSLQIGENSAASDLFADLLRKEPKWVLAVEERFKYLVLGKGKGTTSTGLRVHFFCPALKEKRDAIRHTAVRRKFKAQAAGWEPKRFLAVHVTPKSKPPARILGAKPGVGVPLTALHPPDFNLLIDMDPRLVVAMLDLLRDADISALVLRFGGECKLIWLNDKNALAVSSDPARAAAALRRLDHGSVYQGAVVIQNGGASGGNVSVGGGSTTKRSNPWKKALASESDSWDVAPVSV